MERLRIPQAVVVEGRYDKIRLESVLDALIIPVGGFGVFSDKELRAFLRKLAAERGLVVLTDSDAAGFKIRNFLRGLVPQGQITDVYIPDIFGKERRKAAPSKEGKLGVEGMDTATLREAFRRAGIDGEASAPKEPWLTRLDLYEDGFYGGGNSTALRGKLYSRLGLPARLSVNSVLELLNSMLDRARYDALVQEIVSED